MNGYLNKQVTFVKNRRRQLIRFITTKIYALNVQILEPMNPCIENELRLHVMTHVHLVKTMLHQPIVKNMYTIKLQPLQLLNNFVDTKSTYFKLSAFPRSITIFIYFSFRRQSRKLLERNVLRFDCCGTTRLAQQWRDESIGQIQIELGDGRRQTAQSHSRTS